MCIRDRFLYESPASVLFALYFVLGERRDLVPALLLLIWQVHYFHRGFIYPWTLRTKKKMPVMIVFFAILFNTFNTYLQGRWIFTLSGPDAYTIGWLSDPRFIFGVLLFALGFAINKHSDHILVNLRKPGETGYKIPRGGLFEYVTSANYFGEIITWLGWACLTWSWAAVAFFFWNIANLAPRAYAHHQWYKRTFVDYPEERKILVPFLW